MRIISFSKKWDKLNQLEFTTFRFPRKDRDWELGEMVQVYFKSRSPQCEKLGIAVIPNKTPKTIRELTETEAIEDGFNNAFEMWIFLGKPDMAKMINKLILKWSNPVG